MSANETAYRSVSSLCTLSALSITRPGTHQPAATGSSISRLLESPFKSTCLTLSLHFIPLICRRLRWEQSRVNQPWELRKVTGATLRRAQLVQMLLSLLDVFQVSKADISHTPAETTSGVSPCLKRTCNCSVQDFYRSL